MGGGGADEQAEDKQEEREMVQHEQEREVVQQKQEVDMSASGRRAAEAAGSAEAEGAEHDGEGGRGAGR